MARSAEQNDIATTSDAATTQTQSENIKAAAADPEYLQTAKTLSSAAAANLNVDLVFASDTSAAASMNMTEAAPEVTTSGAKATQSWNIDITETGQPASNSDYSASPVNWEGYHPSWSGSSEPISVDMAQLPSASTSSAMGAGGWDNAGTGQNPTSDSSEYAAPPISWETPQASSVANQVVQAIESGNQNALSQLGPVFDQTMSWPQQQAAMQDIANQLNAKGLGMAWTGTDGNLPSLIVMDPSGTQGFELYWSGAVVPRTGADVGLTGSGSSGELSPLEASGNLSPIDSIAFQSGSPDDAAFANEVVNAFKAGDQNTLDGMGAQFNNLSAGDQLATENEINSMLQQQGLGSVYLSSNGEPNIVNQDGAGYHLSWSGGSELVSSAQTADFLANSSPGSDMSASAW